VELNDRVLALQKAGVLPAGDTCDLVVTDRGFDCVAPVIHEWTYEAMAYDLLNLEGNVFRYEADTQGGKSWSRLLVSPPPANARCARSSTVPSH
jgi:syntaxin-binding protein 1